MAAKAKNYSARAENQLPHHRGRLARNKIAADWNRVHAMLTDPQAPRRDALGRTVYEAWADLVLANPAVEFARVVNDILPKDIPIPEAQTGIITSIQALYLTAVQKANAAPEPRAIELKSDDEW